MQPKWTCILNWAKLDHISKFAYQTTLNQTGSIITDIFPSKKEMSWKIDWCCYNAQHLGYHTVEKAKGDRNTYKNNNNKK